MTDVTMIFEAVIALVSCLITTLLIPWIKAKTTESQQARLQALVRTGVYAAEQLLGGGAGEAKRAWVLDFLAKQGVTFDADAVAAMIEAEVGKININTRSILI